MTDFEQIKDFYTPIQPSIKADHQTIAYTETQPTSTLRTFIYCFWQLKTPRPLAEPFTYRVVSDGCIDVFFNTESPTESFVMGFHRKYTTFSIGTTFNYIGIRFLPSAFPLLFGISAQTLSNQSQDVSAIVPSLATWIATTVTATMPFEVITSLLQLHVTTRIQERKLKFDPRFFKALLLIFKHRGHLDTEKDLHTGVSPRQLRRVFHYYLGTTPKAFCNVVRFQYILNAKPSHQSLKENKLYFDVGFFDQAHFIKHFKTFYGITPAKAFS